MRYKLIILIVLLPIVLIGNSKSELQCPNTQSFFSLYSYETQNKYGNSNYRSPEVIKEISDIVFKLKITENVPVLDIGTGYGSTAYALLKLGFRNIYMNDLSEPNLLCAYHFLIEMFNIKKLSKLKTIPGDINDPHVMNELPNKYFGFVVVRNVLQFFDSKKLDLFLTNISDKMTKDAVIYFVVEQGLNYEQLSKVDDIILSYQNDNNSFDKNNFQHLGCESSDLPLINKSKAFLFYPCDMTGKSHSDKHIIISQLYSPKLLKMILEKYGFETIYSSIDPEVSPNRADFKLVAKYIGKSS